MYRAASHLPKRVLLGASLVGTMVFHEPRQEKLSIYPSALPDVVLVETPSALESQIGVARRKVCGAYEDGRAYIQGWVSRWIGIEHAVENRVKLIISPKESLTPALLYVGVATLTGSILSRNRLLVTRMILPPVFLAVSAKHFLPKTTRNLTDYIGSIEDAHFPKFAEKHDIAKAHTTMTWDRIKDTTKDSRARLNRGAISVVEKVQEATGLKLQETLGWGENVRQSVEVKTSDVREVVLQGAEETSTVVDQQVEEVKEEAEKLEQEVEKVDQKRLI